MGCILAATQRKSKQEEEGEQCVSTTTPSGSDAMECTDNESDGRRSNSRTQALPPPETSKRLPTDEERLAELRHEPSANLAANILEVTASIEQMASTAKNLIGTYIRRLRDDAGKARASVTELAMRTTAAGSQVTLEQENIKLRAQLLKANEEIASLKEARSRPGNEEGRKAERVSAPPKEQRQQRKQLCPGPPKQN